MWIWVKRVLVEIIGLGDATDTHDPGLQGIR